MRRAAVVALALCLVGSSVEPLSGQIRTRNSSDARRLREAAALESRGDFEGAEAVLRALLESSPTSSGGLFALERVLRAKGDVVSILPVVDTFLEAEPESSGVRSLKLRVLVEADSVEAVRDEARAWLAADGTSEVPYREVSRVYERAFGVDEALGDDGSRVGVRLVESLGDAETIERRRAGARIAIDLGLADQALPLVRDVAGDLDGRARESFLSDSARRAREQGLVAVAAWAYDELGAEAASPVERRQFDQRIIDVALAAGDTVGALEAQRRVAASFSPGSVDRRRATAQVIRLESTMSDPEVVQELLSEFREDFPNAPELDDLAASVAGAFQARGDLESAAAVLEGVNGPKSSLERAYLLLGAGEIEEGRSALLLALTGLPPAEATSVIQFAGLIGRSSPAGAEALAAAGVAAHRGRPADAASELAAATAGLDEEERAPLLAEAARFAADGGEGALAASIRTRILEEHPGASEVAEASLALARYRARTPRGVDEAIRLLEALITERPNAAVVPDARVELERLRRRSGS